MPVFTSDDAGISYDVAGQGAPILLIHGFASNARVNWVETHWVDALVNDGRQVIMFDNRGHGNSEKLYQTEAYGAHIMAQDASRLLEHLGHAKADVMGYSMGARISAFLSIQHPEMVRSAVFGGLGEAMITGVPGAEDIALALEADRASDITDPSARAFRLFGEATKSDLKALAACIRSSRVKISSDMLGQVEAPVLVAVGDKDTIAGRPEPLAHVLPRGEVLVIPGRDHMRATGDKAFKQGVLEFLARRP